MASTDATTFPVILLTVHSNVWLLGGQRYGSPHWLTWKQIHEHDGRVQKGERSTPVVFWKQLEVDEDGEKRKVPIARLYNVWNLEQCQGIEPPDQTGATSRTPVEPVVAAERIVDGMPDLPAIKVAGLRAFYRPGEDLAPVPFASRFASEKEWCAMLFHELGHATGHEKRLNRPEVLSVEELGPTDIGREEVVAEFTASYLCAEAGIAPATIENQAAYIENWTRVLRKDGRALVVTTGAAQRAADYILDRQSAGAAGDPVIGREGEREQEADARHGEQEPDAQRHPNLILVHTPTHASWLNQIEVFFSIVQRKVLTPAVAASLTELEARLLAFEADYRRQPRPVRWKFTHQEFDRRLRELGTVHPTARCMTPQASTPRTTKGMLGRVEWPKSSADRSTQTKPGGTECGKVF